MKTSKIMAASLAAVTILLAGCAGITHEPKVDVSSLKEVSEADFYGALSTVGIEESDTSIMENTAFSFSNDTQSFEIICNIDASSENGNFYSYTQCDNEATAKALFDYYYKDYKDILDAENFSGIKSTEIGSNTAYLLIDGRYNDLSDNTYTPYHDALFLKGDTVIVAIASNYDLTIEKEVNDFLDALGYPHP